jgi:hypothetical protein
VFFIHESQGQTQKASSTKKSVSIPVASQVAPTEAAHNAVMKFMQGLKIADLPEGREALNSVKWITGAADRGENFYTTPEYTTADSLYTKLFETDRKGVFGYKEFFSLQGLNNAGTTKTFKYLVVAFKDQQSGEWKILSTFDNANGDSTVFDFDLQAIFFGGQLQGNSVSSARSNYLSYAMYSFLAGHLSSAATALATAKALPSDSDPVINRQIDVLSNVLTAVAPKQ